MDPKLREEEEENKEDKGDIRTHCSFGRVSGLSSTLEMGLDGALGGKKATWKPAGGLLSTIYKTSVLRGRED